MTCSPDIKRLAVNCRFLKLIALKTTTPPPNAGFGPVDCAMRDVPDAMGNGKKVRKEERV